MIVDDEPREPRALPRQPHEILAAEAAALLGVGILALGPIRDQLGARRGPGTTTHRGTWLYDREAVETFRASGRAAARTPRARQCRPRPRARKPVVTATELPGACNHSTKPDAGPAGCSQCLGAVATIVARGAAEIDEGDLDAAGVRLRERTAIEGSSRVARWSPR